VGGSHEEQHVLGALRKICLLLGSTNAYTSTYIVQAGEDGGLTFVGGSREERHILDQKDLAPLTARRLDYDHCRRARTAAWRWWAARVRSGRGSLALAAAL